MSLGKNSQVDYQAGIHHVTSCGDTIDQSSGQVARCEDTMNTGIHVYTLQKAADRFHTLDDVDGVDVTSPRLR